MPKSAPMEVDSEGEQTPRPPQPEGGDTAMAGGEPIAEIFAFPVLKTARAHQDANGLRHNDHYRYRQYCTRRLQRLYKNAKRGHGKGRFKNDNPITSIKSAGDLEILLVQAERNWSFFQQLKGDNAVKQQFCSATAQHGLRKLRKATATANVLHKFSLRTCDLRTQRETEAYELYMQSLLLCEQEKFGEAARMLEKCKGAYERLAAASKEPELYKSMVEEVEPLLKRATHSAGVLNMQVASKGSSSSTSATSTDPMLKIGGSLGGDLEDEQVVATYAYRAAGGMSTSGRSSKVECTNAKTKELLAKATTEKSAAREKVKTTTTESVEKCYEKCRELMQEALGGIHEDMLVKGDRVAGLENYCREQLIGIQLERDLLILQRLGKKTESASAEDVGGKNLKPEEGVRLAEGIKAELARVVELPGELDHDLEMAYPLLNNLRGFFVALCYMVCGKHSEAAAILELVRGRLEMQDEPLPAFAEPLTRPVELLNALGNELPKRALAWHARALALSKVPITTAAPSENKVARDEIQASSNGNQAVFPNNLRMKLMEMSPSLLDLAELELEQPNFDEFLPKNESKKDRLKGALGAGLNKLGGALGGLWGRKS